MFTHDDLTALIRVSPTLGVSILLPTHVKGDETRQDPIRMKNLLSQARDGLLSTGLTPSQAEAFLAPATALVGDSAFWRHQELGLAVFLHGGQASIHKVPLPLQERVVVGPGFHVRPLMTVLAGDGRFDVLAITADEARLFQASRFGMTEDENADLSTHLRDRTEEPDYENPVQASPVARPHTGSVDISNAQVYGDSPEDWRKGRLVESVRRIAAAMNARSATHPVPVVVIADVEIGGHFRKFSTLGPFLAGVVETNPEADTDAQLHEAAYTLVQPLLDADRVGALDRFEALRGSGDPRAAVGVEDAVRAAYQGRVDTLLLCEEATAPGRYEADEDRFVTDVRPVAAGAQDLLDAAAVQTWRNGGRVHLYAEGTLSDEPVGAVLRY